MVIYCTYMYIYGQGFSSVRKSSSHFATASIANICMVDLHKCDCVVLGTSSNISYSMCTMYMYM